MGGSTLLARWDNFVNCYNQDMIYRALDIAPNREERYCKKLEGTLIDEIIILSIKLTAAGQHFKHCDKQIFPRNFTKTKV